MHINTCNTIFCNSITLCLMLLYCSRAVIISVYTMDFLFINSKNHLPCICSTYSIRVQLPCNDIHCYKHTCLMYKDLQMVDLQVSVSLSPELAYYLLIKPQSSAINILLASLLEIGSLDVLSCIILC